MKTTLIIGSAPGNIGEVIGQHRERLGETVYEPSPGTLDVGYTSQVVDYINSHPVIDNVVYCAAVHELAMIDELNFVRVQEIVDTNLIGFMRVVHVLAYRHDRPRNIVAIASDAARVPMRGSMAYCASKAGLVQAVRVAAREMAPKGWRINCVSPGIVDDTPMTRYIDRTIPFFRGWSAQQARAYEQSMIPTGQRATKDDVAYVVDSLLDGPFQVNGQVWEITGGK